MNITEKQLSFNPLIQVFGFNKDGQLYIFEMGFDLSFNPLIQVFGFNKVIQLLAFNH